MITQAPKREVTIDYPIAKIKEAINQVLRLSDYRLQSKNDLLNFYEIAIAKNLYTGIMNVSLNKIDENKTHCVFEIYNTVGGTAAPAIISGLQDGFLNVFSDVLTGKTVINDVPQKNHSVINRFLIIAIVIAVLFFVLMIILARTR